MHTKLPHINQLNAYQFITFRTQDSIDAYVTTIQNTYTDIKIKQYQIDKYLDSSDKGSYLFNEKIEILKDVILKKNNILYEIEIFCIMPNHVHVLLKQLDSIPKIMKYIKGKSAIELNKALGKKGKFWLNNYFDKAIRDEKHLKIVYEYIANNPIKANLNDIQQRIYIKPTEP